MSEIRPRIIVNNVVWNLDIDNILPFLIRRGHQCKIYSRRVCYCYIYSLSNFEIFQKFIQKLQFYEFHKKIKLSIIPIIGYYIDQEYKKLYVIKPKFSPIRDTKRDISELRQFLKLHRYLLVTEENIEFVKVDNKVYFNPIMILKKQILPRNKFYTILFLLLYIFICLILILVS